MAKQFTVQDFFKRFPDDDSCLEHLMKIRHGMDCAECRGKMTRVKKRPVYQCQKGHQVNPMAGTPFERSTTPLQKWFYAMYLFTTSRNGVAAKELQRQLSVTYKTAWRMAHEIRKYMGAVDGDDGLSGHVEIDETFVGGKKPGEYGRGSKMVVFGMVQRGGNVMTKLVPDTKHKTLLPLIHDNVAKGSKITTDQGAAYSNLWRMGYDAKALNKTKTLKIGSHHTGTIEGYWSIIKRSINGTYIHVSEKHLPKYLAEFEYRYNMRKQPEAMFPRLLLSF
jgi:transposase-like protein